jgi:hypothetical protein
MRHRQLQGLRAAMHPVQKEAKGSESQWMLEWPEDLLSDKTQGVLGCSLTAAVKAW